MTKDLVELSKEVSPIVTKATELKIKDQPSMEQAVEFLSRLNQENDKLVADRESLTKPINEALKGIRAKYKPAVEILETAISTIRSKMTIYQTDLVMARRKEEEAIAKKVAAGKLSVDKAVAKLDNLQGVQGKTVTNSGSIQFATQQTLEIINKEEIPYIYLKVDEASLLKALKDGLVIKGAKIKEVLVPVNKR